MAHQRSRGPSRIRPDGARFVPPPDQRVASGTSRWSNGVRTAIPPSSCASAVSPSRPTSASGASSAPTRHSSRRGGGGGRPAPPPGGGGRRRPPPPPLLADDDRDARRAVLSDYLSRPAEQPFEVVDTRGSRTRGKERQLPRAHISQRSPGCE